MSVTEAAGRKEIENDEIEIRLSDIVQFLKESRRRILIAAIAGLVVGALYAFAKPNMYTAQVTVMPEIQSKAAGLGGLGSLAGLAGIDISGAAGGGVDAIRPDIYPDVLKSIPFVLHLLNQPVYSEKLKATMTFKEYRERIGKEGFMSWITGGSSDSKKDPENGKLDPKNFSQAIQLTKEQEELVKVIQANVTATYDKKTGILTLTATEQDPVVAATVVRLSLEYLTNYITTYRTEKAHKQVDFLTQRVSEAKGRYQSAEYAVSAYRDRNRNLFLQTAKIDEQRLQADYLLEQSVFNELSKQLEQAKIKVQEETPVFKILEPATVPLRKSGPKRTFIMIGFAVAGAFISLLILVFRRFLRSYSTHAA
ncbi:GNVR domain-containing protein [Spirosoma pollinicola]|uniref:Lipopolysaccharide biosynthesis protein n=1 Tax=Spirosoma pollinicola TaxID=2057025 RepID=A0A2K8Z5F4_9BACT|nr:GNVR domain-containing protein [Spirosoma pollinicola]AUD05054.1 lipopolysaccharide biosynthesis protein [Spirosoma pollinicola]